MIIYNPAYNLPEYYKAYATSLDFTPSLLHMLGVANRKNPFMGLSIFGERKTLGKSFGFTADVIYEVSKDLNHIYTNKAKNPKYVDSLIKIIHYARELEIKDRVWPKIKKTESAQ